VPARNELLYQHGVNFNELPAWQRRGIGARWREVTEPAVDPRTGEATTATRRALHVDSDLPMKDDYDALLREMLGGP
jgi:tRNA(His) 5'-end guanylyltransferase